MDLSSFPVPSIPPRALLWLRQSRVNWIFVNDATASFGWGSGTPASLQYIHSQFTVPASSTQSFYTFPFGFGSLYCYTFKKALFTVNETQNSSPDRTQAHNVHKRPFDFLAT